jgi:hypothetical protein
LYQNITYFCIVKKFVVIFAIFMLLKPILPVLEYVVFYDYIKNELCENKAQQELECNGQCHLSKELSKAADTAAAGKTKTIVTVESNVMFCQDICFEFHVPIQYLIETKKGYYYSNSYSFSKLNTIFHPPTILFA